MAINLGGVTLGVGIILLFVMRWVMKEKKRLSALVPFILALLYGMLAALAALGSVSALGGITWIALWAGNVAGYATLVWGIGGNAPDVTRAQQLVLTDGGYVIVFLLTLVLLGLLKWGPKQSKSKILLGCLAGILIALSGNVAGLAAVPLGSGANLAGLGFTEAFG
ncbi:hypothetical protein [Streptomyces phaeochromogenes]|uniref:hypothetical protein n=1 Tax=Streptomyces phaeochromogenes TaxID=1923 RepID=UPI002DDB084C|nr:hypothetical protein [Streptomyces phaeochromogenes]WRZ30198.1 hypothetical protein OG931_21830 [Streptomyces phaeochromogenes]